MKTTGTSSTSMLRYGLVPLTRRMNCGGRDFRVITLAVSKSNRRNDVAGGSPPYVLSWPSSIPYDVS